jgi:BirA family transcriptional regulator, biotin operon repressor / biotin---[acetyl-CoA-carboxylase] ligase
VVVPRIPPPHQAVPRQTYDRRTGGRGHAPGADCPPAFNLAALRAGLRPFRLHWFPRLRSTNDHAAVLRRRGDLFAPAVVLTGHQTQGRGRGGNRWWSSSGVLTVTFAMPIDPRLSPQQLPLLAGLVVRQAAAELAAAPQIQLKWPNDILCDGRKLAGLLCERVHNTDLIGLGLNVNLHPADAPPALRRTIVSLAALAGRMLDPNEVLIHIAQRMHRTLSRRDETSFVTAVREYDRHHALPGRLVSVHNNGSPTVIGRCEGIDAASRLLVRDSIRLHRIITGHIQLR